MSDAKESSKLYHLALDLLSTRDDQSIAYALRLLCGLLSIGHDLTEFAPLVAQHVVSDDENIESLAQMLLVRLSAADPDYALPSVNVLVNALESPDEKRRLRAIKTLTSIATPALEMLMQNYLTQMLNDPSLLVRKAALHGCAKFAQVCESSRNFAVDAIIRMITSMEPDIVAGAVGAAALIGEYKLIEDNALHLWTMVLKLDSTSQARVLYHLRNTTPNRAVISVLLHSQDPAVVIAASRFFDDDPDAPLQPLISLLFREPLTIVYTLSAIVRIAMEHPQSVAPFEFHFYPPQCNLQAEALAVKILGCISSEQGLFNWAKRGNIDAVHQIGIKGFIQSLSSLVIGSYSNIERIAAYYLRRLLTEKVDRQTILVLNEQKLTESIASVFADVVKVYPEDCLNALNRAIENYTQLDDNTKQEMALLAVRLEQLRGDSEATTYLTMCFSDLSHGVARRARNLAALAHDPYLKQNIWVTHKAPEGEDIILYLPSV